MDLNTASDAAATATSLPAGIDHSLLENDGPPAFGDRMGTPAADEKVLWKGRPSLGMFARTAFHTRKLALYFAGLTTIALVAQNNTAAIVAAVLGVALIAILYLLAWFSARTTLYILTDTRLIMRIGMAIETRVNIPLKQIKAAHFRPRGADHGDIAFELSGERLLGNLLLWPHVRPRHYTHPQPMLRAVPDAASLAQMIAEVRAQYGEIDRNLTELTATTAPSGQQEAQPAASQGRAIPVTRRTEKGLGEQGLEGAPA